MAEEIAFENIYAQAGDDLSEIPWATLRPMPELVTWLDRQAPAAGQTALVVACGLGDDAEEVSRRGFRVTAFDLVPAAIAHSVFASVSATPTFGREIATSEPPTP